MLFYGFIVCCWVCLSLFMKRELTNPDQRLLCAVLY